MRIKQLLTKSLLIAAGLCMGANSVWGSTHYILNQNFDSQPNVWSNAVGGVTYKLWDESETNYYVYQEGRSSGHNANWYIPTRDWNDDINEYKIEFDYRTNVSSSYLNAYVALMDANTKTSGGSGTRMDYGFQSTSSQNATNNLFWAQSTGVAEGVTTYTIKYLVSGNTEVTNGPTFTMANGTWYHFAITINKTTKAVSYTITADGKDNQSGNFTAQSTTGICTGIAIATPRSGNMSFDNFVITDEVSGDVAAVPEINLTGLNGKERTYTISYLPGETLHYVLPDESEETASGSTTKVVSTSTSGTLRAWTTNGTATSTEATATVSAEDITLNKPWIWISSIATNGSYYNLTLDGGQDQSSVLLSPTASLTATFTPDGGTSTDVTLPYTATSKGTLTVTAVAGGYTSASVTFDVEALYEKTWQSLDFSSLIGTEAVQAALGDSWTQQSGHGRWASWNKDKDGSYNFYQHGDGTANNITVNDKIKMREVILLAEGMGLGRNTSGGEAISVVSSTDDIVAFEIYNGYGNDIVKGTNTYMQYVMNTSGNPSMNSTNGALLVQATVYSPASYSLTDGSAVRLKFKNATAGTGTAYGENFKIDFYNSSSEKVANVRADWWDDVANTNGLYTYGYTYSSDGGSTADNSNVWATYMSDMTNADIDLTMSYSGGNLYVIGTMTNGQKVYYVNYKKDELVGDLTYNLYGNNASLSNVSVASASVVTTPVHPDNVAVTLGTNGYTTYANNVYPLDLSTAKAYKAAVDGNAVKFTLFEQAVPSGTGMLVEGEPSGTVNLPIADANSTVEANDFLVNTSGKTFNADGNATYYAMIKDSDPLKFGTFDPSTLAFPATKAYLKVSGNNGANAKALTAFFGGDVTGISQVENVVQKTDGAVYNIAGQRVSKPTKGLYIVNGKKVMVK